MKGGFEFDRRTHHRAPRQNWPKVARLNLYSMSVEVKLVALLSILIASVCVSNSVSYRSISVVVETQRAQHDTAGF